MTARTIPSDLAGLRVVAESTFGTDPGSGYATLRDCRNIKFTPNLNLHDPAFQKTSDARGPDASIVGGKGGTLTFEMPLATNGGSESDGIKLAQRCGMSLTSVAAGTDVVTGGSTTTLTLASANLGNIAVGTAIMLVSAAGTDSLRFVTRVQDAATTTITVNAAWETNPAASDDLAAIDTLVPASGVPGAYFTFLCYQGQGTTDRLLWTISGCAGTVSIATSDADNLPVLNFEFMCDTWADSEANLAQSNASGNAPAPLLGDKFLIDGVSTETRNFGFDPGIQMSPIPATSGTNGRSGWFYHGWEPTVEVMPLHDTAWITKLEAATTFDLCFVSYTSSTDAWGVWVPKAQVMSYDLQDSDGLLRAGMEFKACDPGANADSELTPRFAIAITK